MKLVDDWRWITKASWSWWSNNVAAIFSGLEVLVQMAPDSWAERVGRGWFAVAACLVVCTSNVLRLVKQRRPDR